MKKIIPTFLLAVSTTSSFLFAQVENRLEAIDYRLKDSERTLFCNITANCNNQGGNLDCYLMMDPAELKNIEEGVEGLKGILGSPTKKSVLSKIPASTTTPTHSSVANSSSSTTMSIKNGEESLEETNVSQFLEDDIYENIYQSCLAKVVEMSRNRGSAQRQL